MVNSLMLEVLHELIGCKSRDIASVDATGPYWDKSSCSFLDSDRADLVFTLNRKGYSLNRVQMSRYSLLCDESNWLQCSTTGHWGCLGAAWVKPVG